MPYARRRTYRRKTTGRYRRRGTVRRVMRGINYYNNPLKLLKLQRHYHGNDGYTSFKQRINRYRSKSRGGKDLPPRNPLSTHFDDLDDIPLQERDYNESLDILQQMEREANPSKSSTLQKAARFGLDTIGRNIRAVVKSLPILKDFSFMGDPAYSFFNYLGSKISDEKFMGDNNAENALLSFVDGEDRPGSVNYYTDKIGELFASLAGNPELVEGLTDNVKGLLLDNINDNPMAKQYYDWKIKGIQPDMSGYYPDQRIYLEPAGENKFFETWEKYNPDFSSNDLFSTLLDGDSPSNYTNNTTDTTTTKGTAWYNYPGASHDSYHEVVYPKSLSQINNRPKRDTPEILERMYQRRQRLKDLKLDPINFDNSGTGFTPKSRRPKLKPDLSPVKLRKRNNLF